MPVGVETEGSLEIAGGFMIDARADRIDRRADGALSLVDYKTGTPPSREQVRTGFSPQLPLEAAIARADGFKGLAAAPPDELLYLHLSGGGEGGDEVRVDGKGPGAADLADAALAGLARLMARYADPAQPYLARPRMRFVRETGDYDHLARVAEWAAAEGGAEE
jgi:ATP-dependent helicase/nuclease subunit B